MYTLKKILAQKVAIYICYEKNSITLWVPKLSVYKDILIDQHAALIKKICEEDHEALDKSETAKRKAFNLLNRASEMKKRSKSEKMIVTRPNDKKLFNKMFESQSQPNAEKCGRACKFSKIAVFEKKKTSDLKEELRKHGIYPKTSKKKLLRSMLKAHYKEHGLDVEGYPS